MIYILTAEQIRQVKEALECAVSDEMFELGKYETALAIIQSLKLSEPVGYTHKRGLEKIEAYIYSTEFDDISIPIYALGDEK